MMSDCIFKQLLPLILICSGSHVRGVKSTVSSGSCCNIPFLRSKALSLDVLRLQSLSLKLEFPVEILHLARDENRLSSDSSLISPVSVFQCIHDVLLNLFFHELLAYLCRNRASSLSWDRCNLRLLHISQ